MLMCFDQHCNRGLHKYFHITYPLSCITMLRIWEIMQNVYFYICCTNIK
uniref:Uncharacterized protein n=1 Tax=Anguilla anguilla TaxID=7936 RepID=A0A0E9PTP3_ANGAN